MVLASGSNQQFHAGVNRSLKIRQSVVVLLNLPDCSVCHGDVDRRSRRSQHVPARAGQHHGIPDHNVVGVVVGVNSPHLPAIDRKMLRNARREKRYCPFS
ncbi:hypothetical protein V4R08_04060 [Nitrobacter sp. NHB1]|uniref:hypothetical protein n=1 Tax=Nitrobacter sp. NHB1 TaxID=3119830 RepID=UPI002FFD5AEF